MSFDVCEKRCEGCLFGKTPIVSAARRRQVIGDLQRRDTHFICHEHGSGGEEGLNGADVQCRGDYDRDPYRTNLMRIAHRLGAIRFVPAPRATNNTEN